MDTRCVADTKLFKIEGASSQILKWKEYRLKICIQQNTLSLNESCEITVKVLFGGMFKLSKGKLISFIYDIYVSKQLLKPVQLTIPHCTYLVTRDQITFLSFVKASIDESVRPCEFKLEKEGQFCCNKTFGQIYLSESCIMAIVKLSPDHLRQNRISDKQLLSESSDDDNDVDIPPKVEHTTRRLSSANKDECFLVCRSMLVTSNFPDYYNKFDPLLLIWNQEISPNFFPNLITNLCKSSEFSYAPPESRKVIHPSRNIISLMCTNVGGKVHFVEAVNLIEIRYSGKPENCYIIRKTIVKEVEVVVKDFPEMGCFKEQFYCKICDTTEHCCSLNEDKTTITCPNDKGSCNIDRKGQLPWFEPEIQGEFSTTTTVIFFSFISCTVKIKYSLVF